MTAPARNWFVGLATIVIVLCIQFSASVAMASNDGSLDCSSAYASPATLWPPNHKYKKINISGLSNDVDVAVQCIQQDEPRNDIGDGNTNTDGTGIGSNAAWVRAERAGPLNGRVYHIGFLATDSQGQSCSGVVTVGVPHSKNSTAVDEGPLYESTDSNINCDGAQNLPPVIVSTPVVSVLTGENYLYDVNADDPDQDELVYALVLAPAGMSIESATGEITWQANVAGTVDVEVKVSDPDGLEDTQNFQILVSTPNNVPIANAQTLELAEDESLDITLTGTDVDNDTLSYELITLPALGSLTGTAPALVYTPVENFVGQESFQFTVSDGESTSDPATILVNVVAVNDQPIADTQNVVTDEDTAVNIVLTGRDSDTGDTLTFTVLSEPTSGVLSGTAPTLTYTPLENATGADSFSFLVSDGTNDSTPADVIITINEVNDAPVADSQSLSVQQGDSISVVLNASDIDGDALSYSIVDQPQFGVLTGSAPSLTYAANGDYDGPDEFTFSVSDGIVESNVATVSISVTKIPNTGPVADAGADQTLNFGETASLDGSNSSDPENDELSYSWTIISTPAQSTNAVLTNPTATMPQLQPDVAGNYTVQLIVSDGELDSAADTVSVSFSSPNQAPIADAGENGTTEFGQPIALDGSGSSDPDGDTLSYSWQIQSSPDGSQAGFTDTTQAQPTFFGDTAGDYEISLIVNDGALDSSADVIVITVNNDPQNLPPTAKITWTIRFDDFERGLWIDLDGSGSTDPEGEDLIYRWRIIDQDANDAAVLENADTEMANLLREDFNPSDYFDYTFELVVSDGVNDSTAVTTFVPASADSPSFSFFDDSTELYPVAETVSLLIEAFDDAYTYNWVLSSKPASSQAEFSSTNTADTQINLDAAGTYVVTATVNYGFPDFEKQYTKTLRAIDPDNLPPVAEIDVLETIIVDDQPVVVTADGSASSDPNGDDLLFTWTLFPPTGSSAELDDPSSVTPSFIADVRGFYFLELVVDDGQATGDQDVLIAAEGSQPNNPPVADAGPDLTAVTGQVLTLDGSASSDADGDPLDFYWEIDSRPVGSNAGLSTDEGAIVEFEPDVVGTYEILLEAADWNDFDETLITITVTAGNIPPVAVIEAGNNNPDYPVLGQAFELDGSSSSDPDGGTLSYQWEMFIVPDGSTATISSADSVTPTLTPDALGRYGILLTVSDGEDTDITTFYVRAYNANNRKPVALISGPATANVGDQVSLDGRSSFDPDGDEILSRGWAVLYQPPFSSLSTGLRNQDTYGFTATRAGLYIFGHAVSDGLLQSETAVFEITLLGDNQRPIANAGADRTVLTNTLVALNGTQSSDPDQDTLSYSWSILSAPANSTAVLSNPASFNPSFTPVELGDYVLELVVSDSFDSSAPDTVTVSVVRNNTRPTADVNTLPDTQVGLNTAVILDGSVSSDNDGDTLTYVWTLIAKPAASLAVLDSVDTDVSGFTADAPGDYEIELTVRDSLGAADSVTVLVTATDQNLRPIAIASATPVGPVLEGTNVVLDASLSSDPENQAITYLWTTASAPPGSQLLNFAFANTVTESIAPDVAGEYTFTLVVSDGELESEPVDVNLTVTRDPATNNAPVANAGYDTMVLANTEFGLFGGSSFDMDRDLLDFDWRFVSQPAGGNLSIPNNDLETTSVVLTDAGVYVIELTVSDGLASSTDSFTVTVAPEPADAPPDPGLDDRLSLFGIDTDQNGSRDDIDRLIYAYQVDPGQTDAFLQFSVATRQMLVAYSNGQISEGIILDLLDSYDCIDFQFSSSARSKEMLLEVSAEFMNSFERLETYRAMNSSLSGLLWVKRKEVALSDGCI